jgi:hypothetical protein
LQQHGETPLYACAVSEARVLTESNNVEIRATDAWKSAHVRG